ncbi:pilus assembly protein [Roseibium denhamense]|uniref:Pilus formation protein N terminal region n=1 Tax=Roseibium denhamense TaxID=76305 RepID=A0ABY1P0U1_9HYPH|nr:pilus assembly protein N-terminal domain-containing protein [Roseibium denhamense]MTI05087.1 pilus assembly protein [Roseibium denhamense]SMP22927.1 Pilus formation protein N terminal region [Roseibium denhamense]
MYSRITSWFVAIAVMAALSSAHAQDGPVEVYVDRAKVFRIDDGAAAVIVGNPFIADVSMFDENTVVVTGKSFGTTNLVILDMDNNPIVDEVITVKSSSDDVVTVYRRVSRESLSCNPECEPMLRLGDDDDAFKVAADQATARNELAITAAGGN